MKCASCGAALYQGMQACPRCGASVGTSNAESGPSLLKPVLILFSIVLVFAAAVMAAAVHLIRSRIVGNPVYPESLGIARSSSELQSLLGQPIQEGWMPFGVIQNVYGSEFAEWTISLKGPKAIGRLHCVANRIGSSWRFSRLLFVLGDGSKTVDLTPAPERDRLLSKESLKKVYLVPLGSALEANLAWAPDYYKAKFGLSVEVLPGISLHGPSDGFVRNTRRKQLVAENLVAVMKRTLPEKVKDQAAILIGVTDEDMYIGSYDWRYAINYREDGRFAVVSEARLRPRGLFERWNRAMEPSRLQKMITKNVYLLCFDVPLSRDYTSGVSGGVMSPGEVDYMGDQIIGAEGQWRSQSSGVAPIVSMVLSPTQPAAWNTDWWRKPPADISMEYFAADLWTGVLIQRKTDFYLDDGFPLQFVRAYGSGDAEARGFGLGTNDSLDFSVTGVPGKYLELQEENGAQTHFDRDPASDSGGAEAYRGGIDYFSPFSQGKIFMHRFDSDLETTQGWHYFFPYRQTAKSESKLTALTGYSDPQGHRFEMERKSDGDLLSITTPAGKWLHFESDPQHRFRRIEDSEGRVVNYDYDEQGRLIRVSDSRGNSELYRYDGKNRMRAVLDSKESVLMAITYSPEGRITSQTLSDGRVFQYVYRLAANGAPAQIQFTDPRGYVTSFDYRGKEYTQSLPTRPKLGKTEILEPFLE